MTNLEDIIYEKGTALAQFISKNLEEKKIALKLSTFGFGTAIAGEGMQLATDLDLIDYNWLTGHLSDFGIVFQLSPLLYGFTSGFNKYARTAASLIPPIISTVNEYYPFSSENITDHTDTALFWLGWAASMAGIKYLASKKTKNEKEAIQKYELKTPSI